MKFRATVMVKSLVNITKLTQAVYLEGGFNSKIEINDKEVTMEIDFTQVPKKIIDAITYCRVMKFSYTGCESESKITKKGIMKVQISKKSQKENRIKSFICRFFKNFDPNSSIEIEEDRVRIEKNIELSREIIQVLGLQNLLKFSDIQEVVKEESAEQTEVTEGESSDQSEQDEAEEESSEQSEQDETAEEESSEHPEQEEAEEESSEQPEQEVAEDENSDQPEQDETAEEESSEHPEQEEAEEESSEQPEQEVAKDENSDQPEQDETVKEETSEQPEQEETVKDDSEKREISSIIPELDEIAEEVTSYQEFVTSVIEKLELGKRQNIFANLIRSAEHAKTINWCTLQAGLMSKQIILQNSDRVWITSQIGNLFGNSEGNVTILELIEKIVKYKKFKFKCKKEEKTHLKSKWRKKALDSLNRKRQKKKALNSPNRRRKKK